MRWICRSGPGPYPTSPLFPRRHTTLPTGPLNVGKPDTARDCCSISFTRRSEWGFADVAEMTR
jgi:hypothetical protein